MVVTVRWNAFNHLRIQNVDSQANAIQSEVV